MYTVVKKDTPNKYPGQNNPEFIVLHSTIGAYEGAVSWLRNPASSASAHAVFGRVGEITQLMDFKDGAWHAGRVSNPSELGKQHLKRSLTGYQNPNRYSIGLEVASGYDIDRDGVLETWEKQYSPQQIKAVAWYIVNEIDPRFGQLPIITHKDIASYKPDLDLMRVMVVSEVNKLRNPQVPPTPEPPSSDIKAFTTKELVAELKTRSDMCEKLFDK